MSRLIFGSFLIVMGAALLSAADPFCPAYPNAMRTELQRSIQLDRDFQAYSKSSRSHRSAADLGPLGSSGNIIDQAISRKMAADSVEPAPRTTDAEFLRRIYLDLSGRIPTAAQADRFLNSADAGKRAKLIDE